MCASFCLNVYICTMYMPGTHRCQKWYWNHRADVINGCELTCGCWNLNPGVASTLNHSSSWSKTLLLLCVHYTHCVFPFCHIFIAPLCAAFLWICLLSLIYNRQLQKGCYRTSKDSTQILAKWNNKWITCQIVTTKIINNQHVSNPALNIFHLI